MSAEAEAIHGRPPIADGRVNKIMNVRVSPRVLAIVEEEHERTGAHRSHIVGRMLEFAVEAGQHIQLLETSSGAVR